MSDVVYLDTSAVLRAVLERGLSPDVERTIEGARYLITSRLSVVETARAFHRLRATRAAAERALTDAEREVSSVWARTTLWELTPAICDLASRIVPHVPLRTPDALHAATFLTARRRLGTGTLLVTVDDRLHAAVDGMRDVG